MSEPKLFLVTTYDEVYKAELAKTALEDEGIFVVLHDRETVATDWLISNAVGGVKLKVRQEDAERACRILTDKMSNAGSYLAESLTEEELTRQALAEPMEDGTVAPPPAREVVMQIHLEDSPTEEANSAIREAYALRFLRTATYSLAMVPLVVVAVYFGIKAIFSPGRLSSEGHNRITYGLIACCFNLFFLLCLILFVSSF
jgi:Putative prokaryotic signal transducing protein